MIAHQSLHLNSVAEKFHVSRPAISKHIKILTECGLITIKQHGRHRYCEAKLDKLNEVSHWVEQYRKFWTQKLDALETYLDDKRLQQQVKQKTNQKTKKHVKSKEPLSKLKEFVINVNLSRTHVNLYGKLLRKLIAWRNVVGTSRF